MDQSEFGIIRAKMVSNQLRTTAVNDPRVVEAMREVPRERHLPPALAPLAYTDRTLTIGGRGLPEPMVTGRLLTEARVRPGDRALVVAAGGGYAAAILARLAGRVTALESDADLAAIARAAASGYEVAQGPLGQGWAANAPYDLILIDGAVEHVPDALVDQLAEGGRLATGLVERGVTRLAIGRKIAGTLGLSRFADAAVPILAEFVAPPAFAF